MIAPAIVARMVKVGEDSGLLTAASWDMAFASPEVQHFDSALASHLDVGGLQVAMNDSALTRIFQLLDDRTMGKFVHLLFQSAFLLLILPIHMQADPITNISVPRGGGDLYALGGHGFLGESWSSLNGYSNVTIFAPLFRAPCCPTDPIVSVTAYLTSEIGPGITIADQIATAVVAVPGLSGDMPTLFSGLTLGPGSYFLTLAATDPADSGTAAWEINSFNAPVSTDTGVAWLGSYRVSSTGLPNLSYPPASSFVAGNGYCFQVTGDPEVSPVPEPSDHVLLVLGLFLFTLWKSRGQHKLQELIRPLNR